MKIFTILITLFFTGTGVVHAGPISCNVSSDGKVHISMEVPHPNHALVHRPNGETVWLQSSSDFVHQQIDNFSELKNWVITPETKGTVWVDGKATIQPIINGKGKYHLYIAENTETERENTYYIECYFVIGR